MQHLVLVLVLVLWLWLWLGLELGIRVRVSVSVRDRLLIGAGWLGTRPSTPTGAAPRGLGLVLGLVLVLGIRD